MSARNDNGVIPADAHYHQQVLWLIGGLFLIRLAALFISPYNLHGDEAQYWAWSKDLNWGFFTKPPGIAAVIASTTTIFGDAEWAVRLSSPILHSITAYVIYRTARFAFSGATGFWAAAIYLLMPAVWLSSAIVSTDVPLLLCWAIALNAWVHLRDKASWLRAAQLGMAIGLGILCKYAMLFFLPALVIAILFDAPTRRALVLLNGFLVVGLIALWATPNMIWNMDNDFATLTHTAANANLEQGPSLHFLELGEFWLTQLAVFGPVTFGLFLLAVRSAFKNRLNSPAIMLTFFALSPLVIISVQALISRANANWAVTGYVAAAILTAHFGVKFWPRFKNWIGVNLIVQALACLLLAGVYLMPGAVNALGRANDVKRVRGWPQTVEALHDVYQKGFQGDAYEAIAVDKRITFYSLNYYGSGSVPYSFYDSAELYMWMYQSHPENHAELSRPLPAMDGPVLLVNYYGDDEKYQDAIKEDFERLEPLAPLDIDLGGGKHRVLKLWAGYGYTPTSRR